jgi:RNA polymerase sigma-32 factor
MAKKPGKSKAAKVSKGALSKEVVSSDALTHYMAEVAKYPLLTQDEEKALAIRYFDHGDASAAQKLVTSNLRFVIKIALEYSKFGARLIDIIQEGNLGLMQAVKEYNPYKGARLITYAVWWIRGQIQEYLLRHYSMVRIGTSAKERKLFYQLQRERDNLERLGFEEGIAQLSGRLGLDAEDVKTVGQRVMQRDVSLSAPTTEDGDVRLEDQQSNSADVRADDIVELKEELALLKDKIDELRPSLSNRELYVLDKRLLAEDPLTLQQIGKRYGITREAARQMEVKLIEKLRKMFGPASSA